MHPFLDVLLEVLQAGEDEGLAAAAPQLQHWSRRLPATRATVLRLGVPFGPLHLPGGALENLLAGVAAGTVEVGGAGDLHVVAHDVVEALALEPVLPLEVLVGVLLMREVCQAHLATEVEGGVLGRSHCTGGGGGGQTWLDNPRAIFPPCSSFRRRPLVVAVLPTAAGQVPRGVRAQVLALLRAGGLARGGEGRVRGVILLQEGRGSPTVGRRRRTRRHHPGDACLV